MPLRVVAVLAVLVAAVGVLGVNLAQVRTGRLLFSPSGLARDVRDVRRRSTAAVVEAAGVVVLALGVLIRERPLVWLGAIVLTGGALMMSVARRGLARRPRR